MQIDNTFGEADKKRLVAAWNRAPEKLVVDV